VQKQKNPTYVYRKRVLNNQREMRIEKKKEYRQYYVQMQFIVDERWVDKE